MKKETDLLDGTIEYFTDYCREKERADKAEQRIKELEKENEELHERLRDEINQAQKTIDSV